MFLFNIFYPFRFFAANALACAVAYILFKCCYGTPREDSVDAARAKKAAAAAAAAAASVNRDGFLSQSHVVAKKNLLRYERYDDPVCDV